MPFCPGCGAGHSAGAENHETHHILGCGYHGPHKHEDPRNQNDHKGRHNRHRRGYQISLLRQALEDARGDPDIADALFDALTAILGEAGMKPDP